jgi:hypothetical protein
MERGVNAAGVVSKSLVLVLQLLRGDDHVCLIGYQGVLIPRADEIVWVLPVLHAVTTCQLMCLRLLSLLWRGCSKSPVMCSIAVAAAPACEWSMLVGAAAKAVQHFKCAAVVLGGAFVQY